MHLIFTSTESHNGNDATKAKDRLSLEGLGWKGENPQTVVVLYYYYYYYYYEGNVLFSEEAVVACFNP
jgi:hypothetical protein